MAREKDEHMGTHRFARRRSPAHQTWYLFGCRWIRSTVIGLPQTEVLASFITGLHWDGSQCKPES